VIQVSITQAQMETFLSYLVSGGFIAGVIFVTYGLGNRGSEKTRSNWLYCGGLCFMYALVSIVTLAILGYARSAK
jgi:hypothetical protein